MSAAAHRYSHALPITLLAIGLLALLGGCATPRAPAPPPAPSGAPAPAPVPAPVAILISDDVSLYKEVAAALGARLARVEMYTLGGDSNKARDAAAKLKQRAAARVVAIGSLATRAVAGLPAPSVVYCLDFTPEAQRPESDAMRGVRAHPPAFEQLQAWKRLDPGLKRVVLIGGEGGSELVQEALVAAPRLEIDLEHIEVRSDRELLYVVKRLPPDVQGIWFPPDSRVLSAAAMREVLAHSLRQGKQTLVFSSHLLQYGALLSVEADPRDVAERVLEQLRARPGAPSVLPLQRARTEVNLEIARQLGLAVPDELQGGRHVF